MLLYVFMWKPENSSPHIEDGDAPVDELKLWVAPEIEQEEGKWISKLDIWDQINLKSHRPGHQNKFDIWIFEAK